MEKIAVIVVDEHPMLRGGIRSLLQKQDDMLVVGEAENSRAAIQLAQELRPNVMVMDINLNGVIDLQTTEEIKQRWPAIKVVAFSMHSIFFYLVLLISQLEQHLQLKYCNTAGMLLRACHVINQTILWLFLVMNYSRVQ